MPIASLHIATGCGTKGLIPPSEFTEVYTSMIFECPMELPLPRNHRHTGMLRLPTHSGGQIAEVGKCKTAVCRWLQRVDLSVYVRRKRKAYFRLSNFSQSEESRVSPLLTSFQAEGEGEEKGCLCGGAMEAKVQGSRTLLAATH